MPDPTLPTQSNKRNQLSQEGALESVDSIQILLALVLFGKNVQGVFASSVRDQSAYFASLWHRIALSSLVPFDLTIRLINTVQSSFRSRTCKNCGSYHCTITSLCEHERFAI